MHGPQTVVRAPGIRVLVAEAHVGRRPPDRSRDETLAHQSQYQAVSGIPDRLAARPSWEVRIESFPRPTLGLDHGFCSVHYHLLSGAACESDCCNASYWRRSAATLCCWWRSAQNRSSALCWSSTPISRSSRASSSSNAVDARSAGIEQRWLCCWCDHPMSRASRASPLSISVDTRSAGIEPIWPGF